MRGNDSVSNAIRFAVLLLLQVFLLRQMNMGFGGKDYFYFFLSPLYIALIPLRTPRPLVVILGFAMGLAVDLFYDTPGVHAAAGTFAGFVRQFILRSLEPKDGYKIKSSPDGKDLSGSWWAWYLFWNLLAYAFFYFCMESFAPAFWRDILLKTLATVPVSWILCFIFVTFLRPRL